MPKAIELTFELSINKVSCPGVWLCQDGLVSLSVHALGTSYQTCMLAPIFPLMYRDVFYFRRRFQERCTISNIFCLLKDETIYAELVQWSGSCSTGKCTVLAQYLGALNDVLFPPNLCSNDGVDLLMRRSKGFPGILAPKIEISTKVRIDEVYDQANPSSPVPPKVKPCGCRKLEIDPTRQKQVCHTPVFHRNRHDQSPRPNSAYSGSCCSFKDANSCRYDSRTSVSAKHKDRCREYNQYHVFNVATPHLEAAWQSAANNCGSGAHSNHSLKTRNHEFSKASKKWTTQSPFQKLILESRFIEPESFHREPLREDRKYYAVSLCTSDLKIKPCVCEICKRYYELFKNDAPVS